MSALHKSLDETLFAIRENHEAELKACHERVLTAETETAILRDQLARAVEARASAERITVKFVTQFAMVEKIMSEVKDLALAQARAPDPEQIDDPRLPEVKP